MSKNRMSKDEKSFCAWESYTWKINRCAISLNFGFVGFVKLNWNFPKFSVLNF